jgi:hypothetical protein
MVCQSAKVIQNHHHHRQPCSIQEFSLGSVLLSQQQHQLKGHKEEPHHIIKFIIIYKPLISHKTFQLPNVWI